MANVLDMKERMVAYLDVLGFRQMVEGEKLEKLETYFSKIEHEIDRQITSFRVDIDYMIFSDTVVITQIFKNELDDFCNFLIPIRNIQWELAKAGIYLRGGIAIGKLHFDKSKSRIVGVGLIRSYDLEQQADFPRIIIDPRIINVFGGSRSLFLKSVNARQNVENWGRDLIFDNDRPRLCQFPSDAIFIDYLSWFKWTDRDQIEQFYSALKAECNSDQKYYLKYRWLIDYAERAALLTDHHDLANKFSYL